MLPPDGGPEYNRLIHEKSPYLLQHARNPVDWYPWGEEAFARAREEDKPIFLSVGYSTCHWCHVMERESFEDEALARLLNANFIPVKVDREERPDIDEIYMNATQILTGSGGWPNSVWLTPEGKPWYAGTYFPPDERSGRPGFKTLLNRLAETWKTRRQEVEQQADRLADAVRRLASGGVEETTGEISHDTVRRALDVLRDSFDQRHGGFGGTPKFPPHGSLRLILSQYRCTPNESVLEMATRTLDTMALGGIRDHIGGGFHRYSTDAGWFLPHFEKMLYDNAQLSRLYLDAHSITGNEEYRRVAEQIYQWVLRDMTGIEGAFYSALDADSEGEEGKFYLWGRAEIFETLGQEEGELFCRVYGVEEDGNFRDEAHGTKPGTNVLYLQRSIEINAQAEGLPVDELRARLGKSRKELLEIRNQRVWPHLDDKVLTAWNGLMIGSFAHAGEHLKNPDYIEAARKASQFILRTMKKDGRLLRTYRDGEAKLNGYLNDYAFLADGLLDLYDATGEKRWLEQAVELMDVLLKHYWDQDSGGFFFTSADHEDLLYRSKDPFDRAIPSGNGIAAQVLFRLFQLTGEERYRKTAKESLEAFLPLMQRLPQATESLLLATALYLDASVSPANQTKTDLAELEPDVRVSQSPVTVSAFASQLEAAPGDTFRVAVRVTIAEGWHINSHQPLQDDLIPTSITLGKGAQATLGNVRYPSGQTVEFEFGSEPLSVYEGMIWIEVPVTIDKTAQPGESRLSLDLHVQACNDRKCLRPGTLTLEIPLRVKTDVGGTGHRHQRVFDALAAANRPQPQDQITESSEM